jgi:hypothetical protein
MIGPQRQVIVNESDTRKLDVYTEGDVDVAIDGIAILGKDSSNVLRPITVDSDGRIITANILERYVISDKDDDASPNYYGFVDKDENWVILKETISPGNDTYRYVKGSGNYSTNWANRTTLTYDYFYNVF